MTYGEHDHSPDWFCVECRQHFENCDCDGGPTPPEPYTREDYEADRADMRHTSGE